MFDIFILTLQCVHASDMIGTCIEVADIRNSVSPDDRQLAREVLVDAREALTAAKQALVDRGANVRMATAAILGLAWPVEQ